LDEQLEQACVPAELQDEQLDAACAPSVPDQENVLMSLRVWPPQEGQATGSSLLPSTISSKRWPQPAHSNSKMGIEG
jgi:hypothetical protein